MHRLFGKNSASAKKVPEPTLTDATSSINNRVAEVDKKIAQLENELRGYKEQLKKAKGPTAEHIKKRAMETLKRKRMYENQRDQMAAQGFNIEQTAFAIDSVKDTQTTIAAMKAATKVLKAEHKKIKIDDIENMQDDLEDLLFDSNDISEALGRSYGVGDDIEDADLDAELACLEDELEGDALSNDQPAYLKPNSLPVQPNNAPVTATNNPAAAKVDEYGLPMHA